MVCGLDQLRSQLKRFALLLALAGAPFVACRPAGAAGEGGGEKSPAERREAELATFRSGLTQPDSLSNAAPSRDALVQRFVGALASRDTAALVAMHMTRAEFAWFYYPTNPQSRRPYDLSPELMWFIEHGNTEKGVSRLLEDRAGIDLKFTGYTCDPVTSKQGENTVIGPCVLRRRTAAGSTIEERLFGLILERGGKYKFVSYSNKL